MEGKQRVLLIGANGFVGQDLTQELLKHFQVTALIRSAPKFGINSPFLKFVNGDATDQQTLENNLDHVNLVVSSFGVKDYQNPNGQLTNFAKTLISAMNKKGVKRLVWIGGAGSLATQDGKPLYQAPTYPQEFFKISEDHFHAYQQISSSGLDYTIVCPPKILPGANDNNYKTFEENVGEGFQFHVKVGHVAFLAAKIAAENSHHHKRVGISDSA